MQICKPLYNIEQNFINYKGDKISTINSSLPIKYNNKIIGAVEISKNITKVKELSETIVSLQHKLYQNVNKKDIRHEKQKENNASYTFIDIIGSSKEMLKIKSLGIKASESDAPVLVCGATGTGKELIVQSIHNSSIRKKQPFIAQNCAALPANLLESILFGSVKGSFTGAENRAGLFEIANGGTLFLDEINSMPIELQAKLLRVIQDGRIRRVGASNTIDIDVRIISAMNKPIQEVLDLGQLRSDLFYRLNVITFELPLLKERIDDLPILVSYFIKKYNNKCHKNFEKVSDEVLKIFFDYKWPGNVRELEHTIESVINLYDEKIIEKEFLPYQFKEYLVDNFKNSSIQLENILSDNTQTNINFDNFSLDKQIQKYEKSIIVLALKETNNNISKAAKLLCIPRQTLQYKIKKLDIIQ